MAGGSLAEHPPSVWGRASPWQTPQAFPQWARGSAHPQELGLKAEERLGAFGGRDEDVGSSHPSTQPPRGEPCWSCLRIWVSSGMSEPPNPPRAGISA